MSVLADLTIVATPQTGTYSTIEEVVRVVGIHLELRMVPIFHTYSASSQNQSVQK